MASPSRAAPVLRLRPSTITGVLDQAFALIKSEPGLLLSLGLLSSLPSTMVIFLLVDPAAYIDLFAEGPVGGLDAELDAQVVAASYISLAVASFGLAVATVGVVHVVEAFLLGRRPSLGRALWRGARRLPAVSVAWLVVKFAEAAGLIGMGIGAVVMMVFASVTIPALAFENSGPFKAVGRSFALVGGRFWYVCGAVLLVALVDILVAQVLSLPFVLLTGWRDDLLGFAVANVGTAAVSTLSAAFVSASATFLYLELRTRREGLDLSLEADRIAANLALAR